MALSTGATLVGFADDIALVIVNRTTERIENAANGLRLAHEKSEAVVLSRKWTYRTPQIVCGDHVVEVKRRVKYLGVMLDSKRTFAPHLGAVSSAAVGAVKAIGWLMLNIGGPFEAKRKLLISVVSNKLLYAAPIWASRAAKYNINRASLTRALRVAAIKVARCYRTVSADAALMLAGIPPGDLLASERTSTKMLRRAPRGNLLDQTAAA